LTDEVEATVDPHERGVHGTPRQHEPVAGLEGVALGADPERDLSSDEPEAFVVVVRVRLIVGSGVVAPTKDLETFRLQLPAQRSFARLDDPFPPDDFELHASALDFESVLCEKSWQPMSLRNGSPIHLRGAGGIECRECPTRRSSIAERARETPGDDVFAAFERSCPP
jgi:hypothetical protein